MTVGGFVERDMRVDLSTEALGSGVVVKRHCRLQLVAAGLHVERHVGAFVSGPHLTQAGFGMENAVDGLDLGRDVAQLVATVSKVGCGQPAVECVAIVSDGRFYVQGV